MHAWGIEGIYWQPISEEEADILETPFDEAEVRYAIFQFEDDKAPGSVSPWPISNRHGTSSKGTSWKLWESSTKME